MKDYKAYYNENDPFAAAWLRNLISTGHVAAGDVDERSIEDVRPNDLAGYAQCHFFAGIGGWSYALRLARWPDDKPVWTGSCPCQPFSIAGQKEGFADERHLWPSFFHLIKECRPDTIFGEQVASKDGRTWLNLVQNDMEGVGYRFGAAITAACGFGAPHIRKRMYFVGHSDSTERQTRDSVARRNESERTPQPSLSCGLEDPHHSSGSRIGDDSGEILSSQTSEGPGVSRLVGGFWRNADWVWCRDQKYRPIEPGTFPLAHGVANRVGKLRGYGNAIVAPQAQAFIEAYIESTENG